jgi:hypothetical protein
MTPVASAMSWAGKEQLSYYCPSHRIHCDATHPDTYIPDTHYMGMSGYILTLNTRGLHDEYSLTPGSQGPWQTTTLPWLAKLANEVSKQLKSTSKLIKPSCPPQSSSMFHTSILQEIFKNSTSQSSCISLITLLWINLSLLLFSV